MMFSAKMKPFWTTFWLPMILVKNFNFSLLNIIILIWILPKGVAHDFGQKIQYFLYLFFLEIKPEYIQNAVLDKKKKDALLFYKNVHFSKSQKLDFSKGVNPFFLSRISQNKLSWPILPKIQS